MVSLTKELILKILPNVPKDKLDIYLPNLEQALQDAEINTNDRLAMFLAQCGHESGSFHYLEELGDHLYLEKFGIGESKYHGRGVIQITFKRNYKAYSDYTGVDFVSNPADLVQPVYAFGSAAWFWKTHNLNKYADAKDVKGATKVINGGYNGLDDRQAIYNRAEKVLGSP